jgi:hypothetical protein
MSQHTVVPPQASILDELHKRELALFKAGPVLKPVEGAPVDRLTAATTIECALYVVRAWYSVAGESGARELEQEMKERKISTRPDLVRAVRSARFPQFLFDRRKTGWTLSHATEYLFLLLESDHRLDGENSLRYGLRENPEQLLAPIAQPE